MKELAIKQALNKAYLKVPLERASVTRFKTSFVRLMDRIQGSPGESEEFLKNAVSEFLKNTFYSDYYINTKGRIDLVIHEGAEPDSPVNVIIEAKSYANVSEMISRERPNTKALQEILLYFLRERITQNNIHLKHLIIMDSKKWFVFDAADFEQLFTDDKQLVSDFKDFESKSLIAVDTGFFYKNIAAPCIARHEAELNFTCIDVESYEKILRDSSTENDNRLTSLYKLLSPEHLLRLPFENDSNTLNEAFYHELLYIMGLCEVTDNGKTTIQRLSESARQQGSFLESVIFQLSDREIGDENAVFEAALGLVITWVNRVLFLKLLEAQQVSYQKGNKDYAFLNITTIKSFSDLNTLFFKVLAVHGGERAEFLRERYKNVPYLNSALFDRSGSETEYITIDQLGSPEIAIFTSTVLKDRMGKKRGGSAGLLQYLFEFLDAYDFSSEGEGEIQETKKTLINAAVLGLIFEKINGYRDGAFFTPGFITTYICRKTLREAVVRKFNEAMNWNTQNLSEVLDNIKEKENGITPQKACEIMNSVRICDPAVGSGHFLVSALNEVIAIKSRLRILLDTQGKRLSGYTAEVVNDELLVFDEDHELFVYNYRNAESRRVQEAIFAEKRAIIENCLFGVDINENSVNICRLRLWIELLKNAYYTAESGYTELETLPNIDINIKCGNSVLNMIPLDADLREKYSLHSYLITDYRDAVSEYKNTTDRKRKTYLRKKFAELKASLNGIVSDENRLIKERDTLHHEISVLSEVKNKTETTEKDIQEKRITMAVIEGQLENYAASFEWRLEFPELLTDDGAFTGFDVVVGNPPYISAPEMVENHAKLRNALASIGRYAALYQKWDMYIPFMELGLALLAPGGAFSMIVPYPFTNQIYAKKMREMLVKTYSLTEVVDLSGTKVFVMATVSNCIIVAKKKAPEKEACTISHIDKKERIYPAFTQPFSNLVSNPETVMWNLTPEDRSIARYAALPVLGDFCYISKGMVLNSDEKTAKGKFVKDDLISVKRDKLHPCKYIEAKDITRYRVKRVRYLEYNTRRCPGELSRKTFRELYDCPKLLFNSIGGLQAIFDKDKKFLHNHSLIASVLWRDLRGVENKSISASVKRYSRLSRKDMEALSKQVDPRYILGIVNSKYVNYLLQGITGCGLSHYPEHLRNLPIPLVPAEKQQPLIDLVDAILAKKEAKAKTGVSALEAEIDSLVYKLYGLSDAEIAEIK